MDDASHRRDLRSRIKGDVHAPIAHDSAEKHVAGQAVYVDDIPEPRDVLHIYIAPSPIACGRIKSLDLNATKSAPGVAVVLTSHDVPGVNDYSPTAGDDPIFVEEDISYAGQPLFAVAASTLQSARYAASLARLDYEERDPIVDISSARAAGAIIDRAPPMRLGRPDEAIRGAARRIMGSRRIGGQDHFYLEGQAALASPKEDRDVYIYSSTQNPTETQHIVARALGLQDNAITVEVRRMGGGFGGKETQSSLFATVAALVASKTRRPAKITLDRDDDMIMTGKRHDFEIAYEIGFTECGEIEGAKFTLESRCGYSLDLSAAINNRAMFHADNAYYLKNAEIVSHRYRTNTVSNTAFRGFGGPQGMMAVECAMDDAAFELGLDPLDIRLRNLYAAPDRNVTPYGQRVEDCVARELMERLAKQSEYRKRRREIDEFNQTSSILKKGISLTPVKFGISFTTTHLNQAGALIHIYTDGSIHLNHGGTEMGQGLMVKVAQVVAHEFQVDLDIIKISAASTEKVPNTSATAASSGSDLNGMAARAAAKTIKARLISFAADEFQCRQEDVVFQDNRILAGAKRIDFKDLVKMAYLNRISLSATGYYKTPKIHFDKELQKGRPFYYYAYGAAVSEVVIDTLTGENCLLRADILHDVGRSLNPAIDLGQIEGGFIQGLGWLTTEELYFDERGVLKTHSPSTYKIPTASDRPPIMNIDIWERGENQEDAIHKSKAVGEPPLMLAISAFSALNWAVAAAADNKAAPRLNAPATPEEILRAIEDARCRSVEKRGR